MKRIFLTVLDACGVGELPDAADYGDVGACTIGHAVDACHPSLPNMAHMGLGQIAGAHYPADENAVGAFGMCREASKGKDTTTGHWEIAGVTLAKPFPTFPNGFPADFIAAFEQRIGHKVIGNKPASGTAILDELGEEHLAKRTPIVYTSADSVFQIACNEAIFSREELYEMCRIAREMLTGDLCVGRVIARPFVGEKAGAFQRTSGRRDFSVEPFSRTLLDAVKDAGMESYGVGKIEDIFALRGLTGTPLGIPRASRRGWTTCASRLTGCASRIWWIRTCSTATAATRRGLPMRWCILTASCRRLSTCWGMRICW